MTTIEEIRAAIRGDEVRSFATQIREAETTASGRWLEGIAVPYGEWADIGGWFREQFRPGAFAKSIREAASALPLLLFHQKSTFPIGRAHSWHEEDRGLRGVWRLDEKDERAAIAHRKAGDGFLNSMSVGFQPIENIARDKDGKPVLDEHGEPIDLANELEFDHLTGQLSVTRVEARLLETSLTPTPAYAGATVTLVRSRLVRPDAVPPRISEARAWLASVRRDG